MFDDKTSNYATSLKVKRKLSVSAELLTICRQVGPIRVIYDCGSLDARDGISLADQLGAEELHIFECNPPSFEECKNNINEEMKAYRCYLNAMAVWDVEAEIPFFPIDTARTETPHSDGNPGASSTLRASARYTRERFVQKEIRVRTVTLDRYCEGHRAPDLLWMDLQGAEVRALRGAARILPHVKVLHLEVGFRRIYDGQALFWDVHELVDPDFRLIHLDLGRWPQILWAYRLLRTGPWVANAIFVRR